MFLFFIFARYDALKDNIYRFIRDKKYTIFPYFVNKGYALPTIRSFTSLIIFPFALAITERSSESR